MKRFISSNLFLLLVLCCSLSLSCKKELYEDKKQVWITTTNKFVLLEKADGRLSEGETNSGNPVITITPSKEYQVMDGFGYALTQGSAKHLLGMSAPARSALLKELFGVGEGDIGLSYLRLTIGASDLNDRIYSYNDLPEGDTDLDMSQFSLSFDLETVIPVLKEILEINPSLSILSSPWSPPTWMKTFDIPVEQGRDPSLPATVGGALKEEYHDAYALYFVKYIQEMAALGIRIDAITIQNEPLHFRNNPSLFMDASQQNEFIKSSLGPAFAAAGIETKIILWDHNADRPEYPISILNDPETKPFVDGSAFHLYNGDIRALSQVHEAHPDKNLYFTEQYFDINGDFGGDLVWGIEHLIIGATRNWSKNVLHWNLTSNQQATPFTPFGGCSVCLGAVTIDGDDVVRNQGYYVTAHASKFVRPGSVRIESNILENLPNVAFKTPRGEIVLIILNKSEDNTTIDIAVDSDIVTLRLLSQSVTTIVL